MIRVFRHYLPRTQLALCAIDALLLFGSVYASVAIVFSDVAERVLVGELWSKALGFTIVTMVLMTMTGLYQRWLRDDLRGLLFRTSVAFLFGLLAMYIVHTLEPKWSIGIGAFAVAFVLAAAGIVFFRTTVYVFADSSLFRRRVVVLGAGKRAQTIGRLRRRSDRRDLELVGFLALPGEEPALTLPAPVYECAPGELSSGVRRLRAEELVVAADPGTSLPLAELLDCKLGGTRILALPGFFEQQSGRIELDALDADDLVFQEGFIQAVVKGYAHRCLDVFLSTVGLLVGAPLMLMTALAIFVEAGFSGPVLYRQTRVGRGGRAFEILKFRSMRVDAEAAGAQWALTNDSRITRVGGFIRRTRLDELPQLFNVIKGDMSFVGPRPERPEFVEHLRAVVPFYDLRHCVNPGITGWAQICYPYGSTDEDARRKHEYDMYYIKNYSVFLDLTILIQTAQVVLWGQGAR